MPPRSCCYVLENSFRWKSGRQWRCSFSGMFCTMPPAHRICMLVTFFYLTNKILHNTCVNLACSFYPPENYHIPPMGKETHIPNFHWMGYVCSKEGNFHFLFSVLLPQRSPDQIEGMISLILKPPSCDFGRASRSRHQPLLCRGNLENRWQIGLTAFFCQLAVHSMAAFTSVANHPTNGFINATVTCQW